MLSLIVRDSAHDGRVVLATTDSVVIALVGQVLAERLTTNPAPKKSRRMPSTDHDGRDDG